jgi:hypothetical protein
MARFTGSFVSDAAGFCVESGYANPFSPVLSALRHRQTIPSGDRAALCAGGHPLV